MNINNADKNQKWKFKIQFSLFFFPKLFSFFSRRIYENIITFLRQKLITIASTIYVYRGWNSNTYNLFVKFIYKMTNGSTIFTNNILWSQPGYGYAEGFWWHRVWHSYNSLEFFFLQHSGPIYQMPISKTA